MGSWKALVVDDSSTMRQLLVFALRRIPGLTCTEAVDGSDGLRCLERENFDIVVTDINMPVMDGLALVQQIRERAPSHKVPIVVVTTEGAEEDQRRLINAGANAFITKPVQAQILLSRVRELLHAG
jgi:two-component system, chemotaxis family, chemotaxis protein CheY